MSTEVLHKYPRTRHLEGSRLQPGDEDLEAVPFSELSSRPLVVEEKMDGANAAISFTPEGELRLQSRGHFLVGGGRERHFDLFKRWASAIAAALWPVLRDRHVLYGEWLFAKHTIFYDRLPHYFMEFDVLDLERGLFLDTPARHALLRGLPLVSVRVLATERFETLAELRALSGSSAFIAEGHLERLRAASLERGVDPARSLEETDRSREMEGLYLKLEEEGAVRGRYKLIRASFLQSVLRAEGHWLDRPIVPNQLAPGARLFP